EARSLRVAEIPGGLAAIGSRFLVCLEPLNLTTEREGMSAVGPLHIVLQRERVQSFAERPRIRASPVGGDVRPDPRKLREGRGRLSDWQTGQTGLVRIVSADGGIGDRYVQAGKPVAELVQQSRARDVCVLGFRRNWDFVHQTRLAIG